MAAARRGDEGGELERIDKVGVLAPARRDHAALHPVTGC